MVNSFDYSILSFLNIFVRRSPLCDGLTVMIAHGYLLKGGIIMMFFWWAWFMERRDEYLPEIRAKLIAAAIGSMCSLALARVLALMLPFRLRPLQDIELASFDWPFYVSTKSLENWSAFPSDHAALFFALAFGLFFVSPVMGAIASVYVFIVILLPRIYIGYHYPTDIVAGLLIAVTLISLLQVPRVRDILSRPFLKWLDRHPASFYACAFLFSFLVCTLFDDIRGMGSFIWKGLH
ncbi:MAG: phosphatase PAP2 family protein [Deltaproteobacteria bacterium]|nr:phosphatase PAP2 family protein [Deltaproteobacteria bacterium]